MEFSNLLNSYIETLKCSSKELSKISGLSTTVISRYRTGKRLPSLESSQLNQLAEGIYNLSVEKHLLNLSKDKILQELSISLTINKIDFEQFSKNFNELISVLKINITEISRALNFDASYVSRIRTGQRHPSDSKSFADDVSTFVVRKYSSKPEKTAIANLINCELSDIDTQSNYFIMLSNWICSGNLKSNNNIDSFLQKLNDFDLNEYIKIIHFDELKVPTIPFRLPTSKNYYGIKEMRNGELDFFKATVLSKNMEPIFMCSDMPMEDMAEDIEFGKKWMFAIAMSLKKGLHLDVIHNLDRPFNELMLGLESWIPIYMTGQLSPYYFKGEQNSMYSNLTYVSGSACLAGECIKSFHNQGKYHLSNNKEDIAYYKRKAECLLKNANPLMQIYRNNNENMYKAFLISDSHISGKRRNILSSPPIFTISDELLEKIIEKNNLSKDKKQQILKFVAEQKNLMADIFSHSEVLDEIHEVTKDEFEKYPCALSLSGMFLEDTIKYSYEDYIEHLKLTTQFAKSTPNYSIRKSNQNAFRNMQIFIHVGKWVMISKNSNPSIHFVIRNSKLIKAIEAFVAPVVE